MSEPMLWIRLRNAIFAESGYNLDYREAMPGGLHRSCNAEFVVLNQRGKPMAIERVPGCEGQGDPAFNIFLHPYPDQTEATKALVMMCSSLAGAVNGKRRAKEMLALGWYKMISAGFRADEQDEATQWALVHHVHGSHPPKDAAGVNWCRLVDEALGLL